MVCCVFVCNIWKAGGLFRDLDNQINCGELTNWDVYSLAIYDKGAQPAPAAVPIATHAHTPHPAGARPEQCVRADPENPLCQLMGEVKLVLNNFNTKQPYRHMAERCPGLAPTYDRPNNC